MRQQTHSKSHAKSGGKKAMLATARKRSKSKTKIAKKTHAVENDIISLILTDHKPLKKLIKVLKDTDKPLSERKTAFKEFGPLLAVHAKSEEETWYVQMKKEDMKEEALEGDVEHGLADQMLEEARRTDDQDLWSARVKVLAELVEHHIKEEEEDILPEYKKTASAEERSEVGRLYLEAKQNVKPDGSEKNPSMNLEEQPAIH